MRREWATGRSSLPWGAGGFPSSGKLSRVESIEHFWGTSDALTLVSSNASGVGAAASVATAPAGRVGIVDLATGTDTNGRCAMASIATQVLFGGGRHRYRADVAVVTASDGTNTFVAHVGFFDTVGSEPTDGVYFRYTHTENSGNWVCVTRSNGVETAANTSVAIDAGNYHVFEIEVNAAGTSVGFYIDGALVATNATNIPTGAGRETGLGARILKSAGTTSRSMRLDLIAYSFEPSTPL